MTTHRTLRATLATALVAALAAPAASVASVALAQDFPREPPAPAPLEPAQFPPFQEARLANGMQLVVVESREQPVVSISLALPAGSAHDPVGKEGMADLVAGLLTKGAGARSAEEIAATIEGVGGSLTAYAGADFLTAYAGVLTPDAQLAFDLLADVVVRPAFPPSEVELARTQTLSGLQLQLSQPAALATRFFNQNLYGEHPYARSATPETVRAISRDDIVAWQAARLRPVGALLVVAGDMDLATARRMAETSFAGWTGAAPAAAEPAAPPQRTATGILLVHRPGSVQSNIVVGNTTFGPADPLRYAATIANQVLGGGADSRLFLVLREQKGWTYGAYSSMSRPLGPGAFRATAEVRTEVTDSALVEMLSQLRRLRSEPVPAAELEAARGALVGSFPLTIETAQQIAGAVSQAKLLGLGTDYLHEYRNRLAAVSAADLQKAAQTAIRPDSALIVVVGDGARIYESLTGIAPVRIVSATGDPMTPDDLVVRASSVKLDPGRLQAGRDSFAVLVQGNPFGHTITEVARTADGGFTISESSRIGPIIEQRTTVTLSPALEPRRVEQSGTFQGQATRIDVTYAGGRVTGLAATPGGAGITEKTMSVEVPEGVIDDNTLSALLPVLPWTAGASFTLPVFASGQGQLHQMKLAVAGVEQVTVPAGTFQAFRVEATGGPAPVTFFIEQAAPHRLLKIQPTGQPLEIVRASGDHAAGSAAAAAPRTVVVDSAALLDDITRLAHDSLRGRLSGTPGNAKARDFIAARFDRLGLGTVGAGRTQSFTFTRRRDSSTVAGTNVIGVVRGTERPDQYIVVTAHFDHVGVGRPVDGDSIYNGADDNASGAAALLALAGHFAREPARHSLLFVALDAEEQGLQGARAFLADPPVPRDAMVLNVNMDMVSNSARGELYAAGASKYPQLRAPLERVARTAPITLLLGHDTPEPTPRDDWTMQSDQGVFHQAGIPFVYFGVEDHPYYHQPSDEVGTITPGFYVGAVRTIGRVIRELDRAR